MSGDCFIIAEAGVNHNGSPDAALRLIDAAAQAGADAVKFQTFKAEKVVTGLAKKAEYQTANTGEAGTQIEMIRKLELGPEVFIRLAEHAAARGIEFMSTPFDVESMQFLATELRVGRMKIPSGEITNGALLLAGGQTGLPLIVSTGMSNLDEIEAALGVIAVGMVRPHDLPKADLGRIVLASPEGQAAIAGRVTLLHCTTEYPAPLQDVNLRAMATMRERFGLPVGYSDHTLGIEVPVIAVAAGATVIEKHFTLDRTLPGPDHKASLEPPELAAMVKRIRETERVLGSPIKTASPSEQKNIEIARRALVAARDIAKGEAFTADNLTAKRPAIGISAMRYWDMIGTVARRSYRQDEAIEP